MRRAAAWWVLVALGCAPAGTSEVGRWPASTVSPAPPLPASTGWWSTSYGATVDGGTPAEEALGLSRRPDGGVLVASGFFGVVLDEAGLPQHTWAWRQPRSAFTVPTGFLWTARHHEGRVLLGLAESTAGAQTQSALNVIEWDEQGSPARNRRYASPAPLNAPVVLRARDGGDLVLLRSRVVFLEADGTQRWGVQLAKGARELWAHEALELPGGDWLVAFGGPIVDAPVLLVRLVAATGAVAWSKDLEVRDAQHSFSNLALDDDGRVVFCAGMQQIQGPPGALVRLATDGSEATARAFHLWRANPVLCGRMLMGRALQLLRAPGGWACHLAATVGSTDGAAYREARVVLPASGAPSAVALSGPAAATLSDGSLLVLGGKTTGFELTHPASAPACGEPHDVRELGEAPATLTDVLLTATPFALTATAPLALEPAPLDVQPASRTCR